MAGGHHPPLNRQSGRFVREGVDISLSTLADLIGHACVALIPIHAAIERHVLAGARVLGDDTTVPLPARGGVAGHQDSPAVDLHARW